MHQEQVCDYSSSGSYARVLFWRVYNFDVSLLCRRGAGVKYRFYHHHFFLEVPDFVVAKPWDLAHYPFLCGASPGRPAAGHFGLVDFDGDGSAPGSQ
jgi:hypothetical protein